MLPKEIREEIKKFFTDANDKIFNLNDKCKVFTSNRDLEGFFAVWYNQHIMCGCHTLFERRPIHNNSDYITKIIVEVGDELTMTVNIEESGAEIKVMAPEDILHEVKSAMSIILIDYTASIRTYSF